MCGETSKILERAVATQFQQHMSNHELYEPLESGFRARHNTETALIKITNNLFITLDSGHISILILQDLSAALLAYLTTLVSPVQHSPGPSPI